MSKPNDEIESILSYCDILKQYLRQDAYDHYYRFIQLCIKYDTWKWDTVWTRLRGGVGVDFRYLKAYKDVFISFGIININAGILHFIGIPETSKDYIKLKEKPDEDKVELPIYGTLEEETAKWVMYCKENEPHLDFDNWFKKTYGIDRPDYDDEHQNWRE